MAVHYCGLCRRTSFTGRRHLYSAAHRRRLREALGRLQEEVAAARAAAAAAAAGDGAGDGAVRRYDPAEHDRRVWCLCCGSSVRRDGRRGGLALLQAGLLQHLAGPEHRRETARFWRENRAEAALRERFLVSAEEYDRFAEAMERALAAHQRREEERIRQMAAGIREAERRQRETVQAALQVGEPFKQSQSFVQDLLSAAPQPDPEGENRFPYIAANPRTPLKMPDRAPAAAFLAQRRCYRHPFRFFANFYLDYSKHHSHRKISLGHTFVGKRQQPQRASTATTSTRFALPRPEKTSPFPSLQSSPNTRSAPETSGQSLPAQLQQSPTSQPLYSRDSSQDAEQPGPSGMQTGPDLNWTESGQALTFIGHQETEGKGNVHTGAKPPWLTEEEEEEDGSKRQIGPSYEEFLKQKEKQKLKKLPAERVGANFDHTSQTGDSWLPSFGRVWNHGRRWQSRHQFRTESGEKKKKK